MDYRSLTILKEKQQQSIDACELRKNQWEKFRSDYDDLKSRLLTLPDKTSYDILVPLCGKVALAPGRLVHTNEILVLLGDNYIVERSSKQAAEIVDRRIQKCDEMISSLNIEENQLKDWIKYTAEIQNENKGSEITEKYDEESEKQWREEHSARVKKQKEAERKEQLESKSVESEDYDIWSKLNELERREANDQPEESSEDRHENFVSTDFSTSSETSVETSDESSSESETVQERTKTVKWKDIHGLTSRVETTDVRFTHPSDEPRSTVLQDARIQTPGQIHEAEIETSKSKQPNSILKKPSREESSTPINTSSRSHDSTRESGFPSENLPKEIIENSEAIGASRNTVSSSAFSGEIQERQTGNIKDVNKGSINVDQTQTKANISRFKARRFRDNKC